jgi:hypothetical protein
MTKLDGTTPDHIPDVDKTKDLALFHHAVLLSTALSSPSCSKAGPASATAV